MPDLSERNLMNTLEEWLLPHLRNVQTAEDWKKFDLLPTIRSLLTRPQLERLDKVVPAHFITPLKRKIPIDYSTNPPEIFVRIQEMFGQTHHPMVGKFLLKVTLLSPGGMPLQTTADLPNFWCTSYKEVRKYMRGRYPKHAWPENPAEASPTLSSKKNRP